MSTCHALMKCANESDKKSSFSTSMSHKKLQLEITMVETKVNINWETFKTSMQKITNLSEGRKYWVTHSCTNAETSQSHMGSFTNIIWWHIVARHLSLEHFCKDNHTPLICLFFFNKENETFTTLEQQQKITSEKRIATNGYYYVPQSKTKKTKKQKHNHTHMYKPQSIKTKSRSYHHRHTCAHMAWTGQKPVYLSRRHILQSAHDNKSQWNILSHVLNLRKL